MELITMTNFILGSNEVVNTADCCRVAKLYTNYALFLQTPLELGMFIPCDKEGNVLSEPDNFSNWKKYGDFGQIQGGISQGKVWSLKCKQYQEAKSRVLFEGDIEYKNGMLILGNCELHYNTEIFSNNNIEWLIPIITYNKFKLTLTTKAIEQLK